MQVDNAPAEPRTPARQTRRSIEPALNANPPGDGDDESPAIAVSTTTDTSELLRQQLTQMQQQMDALKNQLRANSAGITVTRRQHQSREYWAMSISKSVVYPGEDSSKTAKLAYKQKLDAYLRKCTLVWDLITGKSACPIASDAAAIAKLKGTFGDLWNFEPKDIQRSMTILKRADPTTYSRVNEAMTAGTDTLEGSWADRNAALYTVVCATLDLSKNGKDLDFLEVVHADNGLAIYNLIKFRLQEIKSSDPLARAIKLQMGLHHIRYIPKPHGTAKYFATIENHRTELASLPKPKIIGDWQVVTKALRELPAIHPKFKSVAWILEVQRKIDKSETTLQQCRKAFVSADIDHNISAELQAASPSKKKRLRANAAHIDGLPKRQRERRTPGRYKIGDCIHHPKSDTHLTVQCTNPFGIRSAFGLAQSYEDKCAAVKASVSAGWSPQATHVKVPQGYGCDKPSSTTISTVPPTFSMKTNVSAIQHVPQSINADDLKTYHRVRALMDSQSNLTPPTAVSAAASSSMMRTLPTLHQPQLQTGPCPQVMAPPVRAFHTAVTYPMYHPASYAQPTIVYQQPPPQQPHPYQLTQPQLHMRPPIRANASNLHQQPGSMHPPTDDDLVAAGMRYYATQAGRQDFR